MEKVKVKRYVSGKRPDYAPMQSSDEEEEDFQFIKKGKEIEPEVEQEEDDMSDPRLRRLLNRVSEDVEERYPPRVDPAFGAEILIPMNAASPSCLVSLGLRDTVRFQNQKLWQRAVRNLMKALGTQSEMRAARKKRRRRLLCFGFFFFCFWFYSLS